jgi:hypothetical protein
MALAGSDDPRGDCCRTPCIVVQAGCIAEPTGTGSAGDTRTVDSDGSPRIWAELHEKAFRRLGGAMRRVVLDNLREGVLIHDIHRSE